MPEKLAHAAVVPGHDRPVRILAVPLVLLAVACSPGSVATGGDGAAGRGGTGGTGGAGQAGGQGGAGGRRDGGTGGAVARADGPRTDGPGTGGGPETDAPRRMDGAAPVDAARTPDAAAGPVLAYVGQDDQRIHVYALDLATGALAERGATQTGNFPSFLALAPSGRFLYAVNEGAGQVASLSLDPATGALALLGTSPDDGGPTHLSVDPSGRFVLAAQYGGGTTRVFPIGADGRAGAAVQTLASGANAHQARVDPGGAFAFVPCLGTDRVVQYRFDAQSGQLAENGSAQTAAGAGPRHLDFHPTRALVYLVNEKRSTLGAYTISAAGTLSEVATVSTLPAGFSGANTGAEVVVHPGGGFVYTSNRGHDSIARFAIDAQTGAPTLLGTTPTTGAAPRSFAIDAAGRWLVVANQDGRSLVSFAIDAQTGALSPGRTTTTAAKPYFVGLW